MKVHNRYAEAKGYGVDKVGYADADTKASKCEPNWKVKALAFGLPCAQGSIALNPNARGRVDDLIEIAKAHIRAKVEHPFRLM